MATSDAWDNTNIGTGIPERRGSRRARSTGLAVAAAGIVIFNVSPFLNWVDPGGDANPRTGYETDSLIPFIAYLGLRWDTFENLDG